MRTSVSVALVGDYDSTVPAHQAIPIALDMAAVHHGITLRFSWICTADIRSADIDLQSHAAVWCVPASPYKNTQGALDAIRFAREQQVPFLGTCGGFQHALLEYAHHELGISHPAHAEMEPGAANPLIAPLNCSLIEKEMTIVLQEGSRLHRSYGAARIQEQYRCSYGLNPNYEASFSSGAFRPTAYDEEGQVRGAELTGHPFFIGTLFQPERRALYGHLPPLVRDFVGAACST